MEAYRFEIDGQFALVERLAKAYRQTARYDGASPPGCALDDAPAQERAPMLVWLGDLAYHDLADLQRALASWNSALDLDPSCRAALDLIEAACVESESWDLLVVNLNAQIERFEVDQEEERYSTWARVVRLANEGLQRPELAVTGLSEMLALRDLAGTRVELAGAHCAGALE